ncbi:MAG: hypothetical protein IT432_00790 [Phycisphaerales bacterium]|nr:hypothetical protein [Phycisphaerales bacterium]
MANAFHAGDHVPSERGEDYYTLVVQYYRLPKREWEQALRRRNLDLPAL